MEGWRGYTLEAVRALGTPLLRVFARRERTATMDALVRSFAPPAG